MEPPAAAYLRRAFAAMLRVADRLGDDTVNERPLGARTNAVGPLVVHCCGVTEFWLGHVALGRPSTRDRAAEFTTTPTLAELHALVATTVETAVADLARLAGGEGVAGHEARTHLPADGTDESVVLHVLEELYQHLGHMEIAADALLPER